MVAAVAREVFAVVEVPGAEVFLRGEVHRVEAAAVTGARTLTTIMEVVAVATVQAGVEVGAEVVTMTRIHRVAAVAMSVATVIRKIATGQAATPATITTPARIHQLRDIAAVHRQDVAGTKEIPNIRKNKQKTQKAARVRVKTVLL